MRKMIQIVVIVGKPFYWKAFNIIGIAICENYDSIILVKGIASYDVSLALQHIGSNRTNSFL